MSGFTRLAAATAVLLCFAMPATPLLAQATLVGAQQAATATYLIEFAEPGLLQFQQARSPSVPFNAQSPEVLAYRDELMRLQADHRAAMATLLGRSVAPTHHYLATHSGMALRLTADEAQRVRRLPGVTSVQEERIERLDTYRGPTFIGADTIWDGSNVPGGLGTRGEGMVIGVLDSGAVLPHPSFNNDASCGHGVGPNPSKVLSSLDCATTDGTGLCNGPSPLDTNGHGSHTASTSGGNTLTSSAVPPPPIPAGYTSISGVAPCANLRIYKVCPGSTCPQAAIQGGLNSVLLHGGVSVVNFSISGGQSPWIDNDRRKLDLVNANVLVAASAGNTSDTVPNPVGQVNHRGPWVMSVAASTHDAQASGLVSVSGPGTPPANLQNIAMSKGSDSPNGSPQTNLPIRHFTGQVTTAEGCTATVPAFPAGFFTGAVALVHRGGCSFTEKITNAFNAGAAFVIIRNNTTAAISMSTPGQPNVPAYSIEQVQGDALVAFVDANPATATVNLDIVLGNVLAGFSLRGPTAAPLGDLQKPNITGPGVGILAVTTDASGYGTLSGTSMSSPHLAGAATLIRKVHPTWTPTEVIAAIQTTANRVGRKDNVTSTWDWDDVGSGSVDLTKAARVGLLLNETFANFLAANPATGGDVKTLNLPSVRNRACAPSCTFTRTVRSVLGASATYDVTVDNPSGFVVDVAPSNFTIAAGATQVLTITVTPQLGEPGTAIRFGAVNLTHFMGPSPQQHITVAVQGAGPSDTVFSNGFE
jgi:subtilisin family serine protease